MSRSPGTHGLKSGGSRLNRELPVRHPQPKGHTNWSAHRLRTPLQTTATQPHHSALPDTHQCVATPESATTHPAGHPIRVQPCVTPGCEHAAHPLYPLHRMVVGVAAGCRRNASPGASPTQLAGATCAYKELSQSEPRCRTGNNPSLSSSWKSSSSVFSSSAPDLTPLRISPQFVSALQQRPFIEIHGSFTDSLWDGSVSL